MTFATTGYRRASRISRIVFGAGLALLVAGTGLTLQPRSLAKENGGLTVADVPAQTRGVPLRGVVREAEASRISLTACIDAKSDQEKMQGKWKIVHCEYAGREPASAVGLEDTISGATWLRPGRRTAEYRLKLDPTQDPKWVDLSADRLGDQFLKGIYSLEGDKLTLCYTYSPESQRPAEFKTMPGDNVYLYVLERVKEE